MTRTVARELMFWKGRVYGAPFGGVLVCFSSEMMDDTGRGAMRWCAHRTGWRMHQSKSFHADQFLLTVVVQLWPLGR